MLEPRALTRLVLADDWTVASGITQAEPQDIAAAIAAHESLAPLLQVEPAMDPNVPGSACSELRKWLKPIGMANWPEASWDRGEWLSATMLALSDLPPKIAIAATKQAIHRDFRFPNEVKPVIREIAAQMIERNKLALWRLRMMHDEIARAAAPQPQIEQQPMEWDEESIDRMNAIFAKLGVSERYRLNGTDCEVVENNSSAHIDVE